MIQDTPPSLSPEMAEELYQHLGQLFYAVAQSDGRVHPKEIKAMHESVRAHWLDLEDSEDGFLTDAAYQIEAVFDYLDDTIRGAEESFSDFQAFAQKHPSIFNEDVCERIIKTVRSIAEAFAGTNKQELDMLLRLDGFLKQLN